MFKTGYVENVILCYNVKLCGRDMNDCELRAWHELCWVIKEHEICEFLNWRVKAWWYIIWLISMIMDMLYDD